MSEEARKRVSERGRQGVTESDAYMHIIEITYAAGVESGFSVKI